MDSTTPNYTTSGAHKPDSDATRRAFVDAPPPVFVANPATIDATTPAHRNGNGYAAENTPIDDIDALFAQIHVISEGDGHAAQDAGNGHEHEPGATAAQGWW